MNEMQMKGKVVLMLKREDRKDDVERAKDSARLDMLLSLIESPSVSIAVDAEYAEELRCRVAGKWFAEDDGIADIYAAKLFGKAVSDWDEGRRRHYIAEYEKRYALTDLLESDKGMVAKAALAVLAVAAVGCLLAWRRRK